MLADFKVLLDTPLAATILIAVGALIGMMVERVFNHIDRENRRAYWRGRNGAQARGGAKAQQPIRQEARPADAAAEQLKVVMRADFQPRPLLNKREAPVFRTLDQTVIARNSRWQVMAQVSLGEFIASEDREAYGCVNSKRVDFALMDADCHVRHALEYQGAGHHQGSAAARDAVKKEALRKAGIGYHEIIAGHTTPAELKRLIDKLVPEGKSEEAA